MTAEYEVVEQGQVEDVPSPEPRGGVFRERRIAIRTKTGHRVIAISRTSQAGLVFIGLMMTGWLAYSGYALVNSDLTMKSSEQARTAETDRAAEAQGARDALIAQQLRTYQQLHADLSVELTDSQGRLKQLMAQKSRLEGDLSASTEQLNVLSEVAAAATAGLAAKQSTVDGLVGETSSLKNELTDSRQRVSGLEHEKAELLAVEQQIEQQIETASARLAQQETALADLGDKNQALKSDLQATRDQLRAATEETEHLRAVEADLVAARDRLRDATSETEQLRAVEADLALTRDRLRRAAKETEKLQAANAKAATRIARLTKSEQAVDELLDQNLLLKADLARTAKKIRNIDDARNAERARSEKLGTEVADLGDQIKQLKSRAVAIEEDAARQQKSSELALAAKDVPPPSADEAQLLATVAKLERRITALQRSQQDFLLHVTERTINTIDEAERTIGLTGLGVEWLLARAETIPIAMGGPFIDVNAELMAETELRQEVSVLDSHMSRWERLQFILRVLPLSAPLDAYRVTSKFGKRKDPLNGRWGMHYGMDMAAPSGSPILVPAAGTVVSAGWNAGFGRTIEIDHGMGIRTRYGHLRSITVKKGKKVGFRETIGLLGSSGRSTGPHVHYEILIDGKAVDPTKFLTAGKYVFKG